MRRDDGTSRRFSFGMISRFCSAKPAVRRRTVPDPSGERQRLLDACPGRDAGGERRGIRGQERAELDRHRRRAVGLTRHQGTGRLSVGAPLGVLASTSVGPGRRSGASTGRADAWTRLPDRLAAMERAGEENLVGERCVGVRIIAPRVDVISG